MTKKIKSFCETYQSEEGKKLLNDGKNIKKVYSSNGKRLSFVSISSSIMMAILGFFAFGALGAMIFFIITAFSASVMTFFSKKNLMLKYFDFYRTRVPMLLASALGKEVKKRAPERAEILSSLYPDSPLAWRMCHDYSDFYIGYAKFVRNSDSNLSDGVAIITDADTQEISISKDDENKGDFEAFCNKIGSFEKYIIKVEGSKALLYIPFYNYNEFLYIPARDDYLNGQVEDPSDLSEEALLHQFKFCLLADAFSKAAKRETFDIDGLWEKVEEE